MTPGVRPVISTVILARTGFPPVTRSEFASRATLLLSWSRLPQLSESPGSSRRAGPSPSLMEPLWLHPPKTFADSSAGRPPALAPPPTAGTLAPHTVRIAGSPGLLEHDQRLYERPLGRANVRASTGIGCPSLAPPSPAATLPAHRACIAGSTSILSSNKGLPDRPGGLKRRGYCLERVGCLSRPLADVCTEVVNG